MNQAGTGILSYAQRKEAAAWLAEHLTTAPEPVRKCLEPIVANLTIRQLAQKQFNVHWRQLGRALGLIPSSERRRSGNPLGALTMKSTGSAKDERQRLEQQCEQVQALIGRHGSLKKKQQGRLRKLAERLKTMAAKQSMQEVDFDTPVEEIEISQEEQAESEKDAVEFVERLKLGEGKDPALQSSSEALMNARVVTTTQDEVSLPAPLPEGITEKDVVKTLNEKRARYDFSLTVTRLELDVEKKIVVTQDGDRKVFSASTWEFGPPRYAVTWQALATLAVLIGQFAVPFNRLATMLSTTVKRFTAGNLSRMAHYVAERLLPIYLQLVSELADSEHMAGDDTGCRVVEVSSYWAKPPKSDKQVPPWAAYRTTQEANQTYDFCVKMKAALLERRAEGDREAKGLPLMEPSLSLLVGRELSFESMRRDRAGPKQSFNTTVITGRSVADDPKAMIVFYRSHIGSLGNLLEMILKRRKPAARKLTIQCDLSTTNLVVDPALTSRFEIALAGCTAHARRPFALYEKDEKLYAPYMLHLFKGLALHEHVLDRYGRNRDNVLAVRGTDSRVLWQEIKDLAHKVAQRWAKDSPLGAGARYIIRHFEKLTAYLRDPRLDASNNLRERLLRTEKIIERSSLFRRTIEGRAVLDILRTILQTAVAAGAPAQEYLVDVMKTDPDEIAKHPENYTPLAWARRQAGQPPKPKSRNTARPSTADRTHSSLTGQANA